MIPVQSSSSGLKKLLFIAVIMLVVGVCLFVLRKRPKPEERTIPDEPYEAFMLQRTYPNKTFDIQSYKAALNAAFKEQQMAKTNSSLVWELEGPGNIGGRFNCVAVDPNNSAVIYAGSANGGVWKTTDNGQNWLPITDGFPYQAIGAIAINPSNSNEIWVGTGDLNISGTLYTGNGVYKSTDGGQSWIHLGLADSYVISSIVFNSVNTSEVLISTMGNPFFKDNNRGLYKSADGGLSFIKRLFVNDSTGIIDMVQHPTNPAIVYCSSFSRLRTEEQSLVYGTEVAVYKSTDFGQNWVKLAGGLPNGAVHQRLGLAICKSNPNILYALYSTSDGNTIPELYKTSNGGTTWQQVNINTFDMNSYGAYGWYFGKIYCDPNNADLLYVPGIDLLYSSNGGADWSLRTPPWYNYAVHGDGHYLHFNSSSDMIYCTDGGLYRTNDGGNNWTDIENIPNNQFYAVTENPNQHGEYAGGVQDNGTMFGNAAGMNNYTRLYGGDGFTVAYTPSSSLVYSESQNGSIVYDDNFNSGNWQDLQTDPSQNYNWHTPYVISTHNSSVLFYGAQWRIRNHESGAAQTQQPATGMQHQHTEPVALKCRHFICRHCRW